MNLAECMARALAAEQACVASDRYSVTPAGRSRETWRDYLPQACAILIDLAHGPVRTAAMRKEIDLARKQLAQLRSHAVLVETDA